MRKGGLDWEDSRGGMSKGNSKDWEGLRDWVDSQTRLTFQGWLD